MDLKNLGVHLEQAKEWHLFPCQASFGSAEF